MIHVPQLALFCPYEDAVVVIEVFETEHLQHPYWFILPRNWMWVPC